MSQEDLPLAGRRLLLRRSLGLLALGSAMAATTRAAAAAKTPKADVKYQFTPRDSARCGLCASFIPPAGGEGGAPGTCKIVDGPIPQNGWCVLFSPAK